MCCIRTNSHGQKSTTNTPTTKWATASDRERVHKRREDITKRAEKRRRVRAGHLAAIPFRSSGQKQNAHRERANRMKAIYKNC
jgi:hypothetical protein